ncbi:mucoidy inhibitor MuiA family protein [Methylocapsa aurea]|uniref:mucoidy inhibitor MuiA family protein n=1 Tax=Methylocapsa aurea TaxID=663610 RepID=UPI000B0ABBDA|nr:mucoidy inhibitor MuiA family protein [Methylocapsa aurea]
MRWFILATGLLASLPAGAADMDVLSKIDAVTIFPNTALVSRVAEVELPPGQTNLIFKNLPIGLDPASLQVSGQVSGQTSGQVGGALVLGSVTSRLTRAEAKPDNAIEARLKELLSEREGWQVTLEALEAEKAMMLRFSQAGPEKLGHESRPLDVADWTKAWGAIGSGLAKLGDELRSARGRVRELDEAILAIDAARARPAARSQPAREISVETEVGAASRARITLTYRIGGANWRPRYEARLETGGGGRRAELEFSRRAAISQTTGEDWTDVALIVSTIRADRGAMAPELNPQRIGFRELPIASGTRPGMKSAAAPPPSGGNGQSERASAPMSAPASPQEAGERQAAIDAGPFNAAFKIAGRTSLAGDGAVKTAPISARGLAPDLSLKTVPALDPTAYLVARFTNDNDNEAPLLPGEVALYRDGSYVGAGQIDFVPAGDFLEISFGADDRVKVARVPVRRKENEPTWFAQAKTETREFKTSIENLHDFPVKITLIDAIPFSENAAISVEQLPATTPPSEKIVADKRGVMSWTYEYAPQEKREIRLGYKMKWPADRDVTVEPAPLPPK